ncbi:bifunctional DNA primase/polymerase [Kitasatospora brasiliensis]|uniref:bifunctional DNA primase/polymerase n=1 Tax=Kitasatospora brasiliensis TaxID=3058040 RepID=UPI0029312593|nr:bifunctional DNA primase/polymerase [Kitasatospora sp. K002]
MENTGLHWLTQAAPDPDALRERWERTGLGLMPLPAGRRWDVLAVPGRLGRPALAALDPRSRGPVLTDSGGAYVSFLVPVGAADRWIGTGVRRAGEGTWIVVPHPERGGRAVRWLVPPDGSGRLNELASLELALHAAAVLGGR